MITGMRSVNKSLRDVKEKLKTILAGANCEIKEESGDAIRFIHGTYPMSLSFFGPKRVVIRLKEEQNKTSIDYEITVPPFLKILLTLYGILFCWTIFAPILVYRSLIVYPRKFIENIIAGV